MLLDRLLYCSLGKYLNGPELTGLEYQIITTDICNYNFPHNIEMVIQGIGKLKPVKDFHGCGTVNPEIKISLICEFKKLCKLLKDDMRNKFPQIDKDKKIQLWLVACLAKKIKEQIHLTDPIPV